MSIFGSILSKLGFGDDKKTEENVTQAPEVSMASEVSAAEPAFGGEAPEASVTAVDVTAQLNELASNSAEKLDWKVSIVDLMKLLGLDSSYGHRKELARELNCPDELMGDSAKMNIWLHKTVIAKLAENGGSVPADLLD